MIALKLLKKCVLPQCRRQDTQVWAAILTRQILLRHLCINFNGAHVHNHLRHIPIAPQQELSIRVNTSNGNNLRRLVIKTDLHF